MVWVSVGRLAIYVVVVTAFILYLPFFTKPAFVWLTGNIYQIFPVMSSSTSNFSYHESLRNSIKQGDEESEPITALPQMNDSHELKLENSRRHRRLLDRFVLAPEVEDPKSYGRPFKWLVTSLVAAAATLDFMGATILYRNEHPHCLRYQSTDSHKAALPELPTDLNTTANVANLAVALSFIGPAIMPLYWSFISEKYGRRIVSISSLALYVLFTALAASSSSISMLIVMRLLSSACSGNSVGPAVIADIWEVKERGHAMSIYYLGPLGGPTIAPVIGGILTQVWDWRATQWFQTVYAALILIFMSFALPETHRGPTLASGKRDVASPPSQPATKSSRKSPAGRAITRLLQLVLEFGIWLKRPLRVLTFTRFLLVNLSIYLSSISYGILIMTSVSTQQAFSIAPYEFNYLIIGLLFLPRSAGLILGTLISGKWSDRIMNLEAKRLGRYDEKGAIIYAPEDRIRENAWFFVALMPAALIWFGWTLDFGVLWIVPVSTLSLLRRGSANVSLVDHSYLFDGCQRGPHFQPSLYDDDRVHSSQERVDDCSY